LSKNNIGREIIPFTIMNQSGSREPAYIYMQGNTNAGDPAFNTYNLSNFNGDCARFSPNAELKTYGLPLSQEKTDAFFPQLDAVRIYISFGNQLELKTNERALPDPAPSADVASDPNYATLWDFVEATWHDYGTHTILHLNVTQVDAFGLAFEVEHSGFDPANPTSPLTIKNGFDSDTARASIFSDLTKAGSPWSSLVIPNPAGGTAHRALMPLKALDLGVFPADQLDTYIKAVVADYAVGGKNRLVYNYGAVNYTGCTDGGNFIFTPGGTGHGSKITIPVPTTRNCYAQSIVPSPNDGPGGAIAAALGASFLRSTLMNFPEAGFPVPQESRGLYYAKSPICEYAKIIHAYGIDNHAFCYGYDEVAGDAGANRDVRNPTSLTLTIRGI